LAAASLPEASGLSWSAI